MADAQKIRLQCPTCGKVVSFAIQHAGKRGKCPGCAAAFRIPSADQMATGAARSASAEARAEEESQAHWDRAIAAADNGRRAEAIDAFRRAIELNADHSDSLVRPSGDVALACWTEAVRAWQLAAKNAEAAAARSKPIRCACCGKDIGRDWHYRFESIALARTVGAQCPDCGRVVCRDDLEYGPDGNYEPCARCGVELQMLSDGPAYSSMVEAARRERLYRGPIKEPSARSRPVTKS